MTIRIKLKHLFVLLAVLFGLLLSWLYLYPVYLFKSAEKLQSSGQQGAAVATFQKVFTYFPYHPKAPEALYSAASMAASSYGNVQFLFPSQKLANGLQEYPVSASQAITWMQELKDKYPKHQLTKDHSDLMLAVLYQADGQTGKALDLYHRLAEQGGNLHSTEAKRALEYISGNQLPGKSPQVTGTFRLNGKPAAGKHVLLKQRDQHSLDSTGHGYPHAVTDTEGKYTFSDLQPGEYEVGIRVQTDEIKGYFWPLNNDEYVTVKATGAAAVYDISLVPQMSVIEPVTGARITGDKIAFRWNPQAGAAFYRLSITSFAKDAATGNYLRSATGSSKNIQNTLASYTLEEVSGFSSGAIYSGEQEEMKLDPLSVIGTVYPGGVFTWSVTAYNSTGKVLNSSAGYFASPGQQNVPLFTLDANGQLEGDRYLLSGDYDKAITAYKKEPENPRALRILARLEGYGTVKKQGDPIKEFANPTAAISYMEKLPRLLNSDVEFLAEAYNAAGQTEKAKKLYEQYPDAEGAKLSSPSGT